MRCSDVFTGIKHVLLHFERQDAHKYTGYLVGGISPFGTRTRLPVYAQTTIFSLERISINGGKHGFLVEMHPSDLHTALSLREVDVTTAG